MYIKIHLASSNYANSMNFVEFIFRKLKDIWIAQKRERFAGQPVSPFPSDAQAVIILVSLLKNPKATAEELVKIMNKEHRGISVTMVERLLEHHGLFKKNDSHIL